MYILIHFRCLMFLSLVMCPVRLVMSFRFVYDIFTFRSRVGLVCHVFPFLRSSLCFVIGSSSCVLSVCSHVFYFMYGVCFRGQFPLSFIMFHDFITHFAPVVTCFILHLSLTTITARTIHGCAWYSVQNRTLMSFQSHLK